MTEKVMTFFPFFLSIFFILFDAWLAGNFDFQNWIIVQLFAIVKKMSTWEWTLRCDFPMDYQERDKTKKSRSSLSNSSTSRKRKLIEILLREGKQTYFRIMNSTLGMCLVYQLFFAIFALSGFRQKAQSWRLFIECLYSFFATLTSKLLWLSKPLFLL